MEQYQNGMEPLEQAFPPVFTALKRWRRTEPMTRWIIQGITSTVRYRACEEQSKISNSLKKFDICSLLSSRYSVNGK